MAASQSSGSQVTRETLLAAAFVLLLPALLFYAPYFSDHSLVSELGELNLFVLQAVLLAGATVAFLEYVDVSPPRFAVLGTVGPYVSILVPMSVLIAVPAPYIALYLPPIYVLGHLSGLAGRHFVRKHLIGPPPR